MTWIRTIPPAEAPAALRAPYDRATGQEEQVDKLYQAHALRPHTLDGHMALYNAVFREPGNTLPRWLLETIALYVSVLNKCVYCIQRHYTGLRGLLRDDERADHIRTALERDNLDRAFDARERAILEYADRLTRRPATIKLEYVERMRAAGLDDGQILEVNQVVAYIAYINRVALGLGVDSGEHDQDEDQALDPAEGR